MPVGTSRASKNYALKKVGKIKPTKTMKRLSKPYKKSLQPVAKQFLKSLNKKGKMKY